MKRAGTLAILLLTQGCSSQGRQETPCSRSNPVAPEVARMIAMGEMSKRISQDAEREKEYSRSLPNDCCNVLAADHNVLIRLLPTREYATHYIVNVQVQDRRLKYRETAQVFISSCGKVMEVL